MGNRGYLAVFVLGAVVIALSMAAFTVRETELAIKFRFGEIVNSDYQPGLHFMTPFINNVRKFDKRILTEDYPAEQFLTSEGKILKINFFVKWRISDVSRYYISTSGGSEEVAARRLGEIVKDGLKGVIARRTIQQVVSAERSEFLGEVLKIAGANVGGLGMTMVDVRVKSIELPDEVSESVYNRMRQDFARQAAQLRAEGSAVSEQTRAEADRERTEILANAYRDAEKVKGEGDAAATDIYARAYGRDPEFYAFYRGLQAYRKSLTGKQGDVMVITPEGEFFKYFKEAGR
jgi:membrane protease subunit HflC